MKRSLLISLVTVPAVLFHGAAVLAQNSHVRCGEPPLPVVEMRDKILAVAAGGSVEELAAAGDTGIFTASCGDDDYTWPAAIGLPHGDLSERERGVLAGLHGGDLETAYVEGTEIGYYVGWTIAIIEDGDRIALVAGD